MERKIALRTIAAFIVCVGALSASKSPTAAPQPIAQFSPRVVNFGYVTVGRYKYMTLTVTNVGSADLVIERDHVYACCGVLGIEADGCAGISVQPGNSCAVELYYSPDDTFSAEIHGYYVIFDNASAGHQTALLLGHTGGNGP